MSDRGLEGLAVVAADDTLVDCISVSDLRGLDPHKPNFWTLYQPISSFKAAVRTAYPFTTPFSAIIVRRDETFGDVLRKMALQKIHRVFVVSASNRLLDIVTQTDVMTFVLSKLAV